MKFKLSVFVLLAVFSAQNTHAGMFDKLIANVAKAIAPAAPTVSSLSDVSLNAVMESNLAPTELGTISQSFIPGWKTGGDAVSLMFTRKSGAGFFKIDGSVTVDGKPADYLTIGNYTVISDASPAPRKVEITTTSGQKAGFTLEPSKKKIKIVSINGEKDNVSLDLSKDVVVELEASGIADNALLKVSLAVNQVGIKSMYEVCNIHYAPKLVIPAAAFRNINIVPGGSALYSYKKSFLTVGVESLENATDISGTFSSVQYTSRISDGRFVNVGKEPDLNTGIMVKGSENPKDGDVSYDFFKPNAFRSRPAGQIKKIGLLSFGITGTTVAVKSVISEEKEDNRNGEQQTRTETVTFPAQSNGTWDGVMAKMYPELAAIVQSELGASILPVEAVTKAPSYQTIENFSTPDRNTDEGFSRTYSQTKLLAVAPVSEGFGVNAANERIMKESDANALMTLTLDLSARRDGDFGVMVPKLTCEITGKINGLATNTKYFTATVTGKGIPSENIGLTVKKSDQKDPKVFHNVGTISAAELDRIVRQSDILDAFRKGLKEMKAKENSNPDYVTVWNLQG